MMKYTHGSSGLDDLSPNLSEANEEELFLRVIQARKERLLSFLRGEFKLPTPCAVGLHEARVTNILSRRSVYRSLAVKDR